MLTDILQFYDIPLKKVGKATCDNGSNFLKAFREFSTEVETDDELDEYDCDDDYVMQTGLDAEYEFLSIEKIMNSVPNDENSVKLPKCHRCTSHTLNLVCTCKAVHDRKSKVQRSTFAKCRAFWNSIGRSVKKNEAVVNICARSVITPGATRWNSLYDAISFFLLMEEKLDSMFRSAGKQ